MTRVRELHWFEPVSGAVESDVRALESSLGVGFPDDYREFLLAADGGIPVESDFRLEDMEKHDVAVGTFLGVSTGEGVYHLAEAAKMLSNRIPRGVVPIAIGPGGDFVALDYRTGGAPGVVYWHHEREGSPNDITPVAATFTAFIDLLFEPDLTRG
jgi:cell wall assembly regulator SMI1